MSYDVEAVRREFPALDQEIHGKPLAYLDNAATTQKPRQVLEAVRSYYEKDNANVHRGVHELAERATRAYEGARARVARFLGGKTEEIVFTRGTTEALNLVANAYAAPRLKKGDEIILTGMEHHSNIVPWQMVALRTGAKVRPVPILDDGSLDLSAYERLLSKKTRIVSVVHVSNALGTINPIKQMAAAAHDHGATFVADGAQAAAHSSIDAGDLGVDFYAMSGHKVYGPTGIGALWGRAEILEETGPWQGGGEMIRSVTFEETTYNDVPHRFEAGTPDISGAVGLGAALDYVSTLGLDDIARHERRLLRHAERALSEIPGLKAIGTAAEKAAVVSFTIEGIHPHDIGSLLDRQGIAIRTGHHCAQPVMDRFQVPATSRASFGCYNTLAEIDRLAAGLQDIVEVFA